MSRCLLILALASAACSGTDREQRRAGLGPNATVSQYMQVADAAAGASSFGQCAACHTIGKGGATLAGPNLFGVYGRPVGRGDRRFGYTAALRSVSGRWTDQSLDKWLTDPRAAVPGTRMAFAGVRDPLERADLIAYLKTRSD
jgi:cytochrome c